MSYHTVHDGPEQTFNPWVVSSNLTGPTHPDLQGDRK